MVLGRVSILDSTVLSTLLLIISSDVSRGLTLGRAVVSTQPPRLYSRLSRSPPSVVRDHIGLRFFVRVCCVSPSGS